MKKALLLLLLSASFGYAQQLAVLESGKKFNYKSSTSASAAEKLLKKEDFKLSNGRMQVNSIPCKVKNDNNTSNVRVSVICLQKAFDQLGVDKINEMIRVANEKTRNTIQLNSRYIPQEIKMVYMPDSNDWSMTNAFNVQDESGSIKEKLLAVDFDSNGNFATIKRIL